MKRVDRLKKLIRVARGEAPPDLVLKGGRVLNVFSGEIIRADVDVYDGLVAGVGSYDGPAVIDAGGDFVTPGFMDAHMHLESTLLSPAELVRAVLARGTTAIIADPHEIANVLGIDGIHSDHECTERAEAEEKLRLGMHIMIREGTQAKNLKALLPLVTPLNSRHCSLVTDDLHPHDLLTKGHLDHLIDMAVREGMDPVEAIRMVTCNTAQYFGLRDVGAVAPGYRADILILSSLAPVRVRSVIKGGRLVFNEGNFTGGAWPKTKRRQVGVMNVRPFGREALAAPHRGERIRVIGLIPNQILTSQLILAPAVRYGAVVADVSRDILKLAVVERHHGTGRIGLGFVQGFGLKAGAIASSVAHDSHNIIAVGCDDGDLFAAVKAVEEMNGGLAAVRSGEVLARLPLPIAGLMSDRPLAEIARGWEELRRVARDFGSVPAEPFMVLSFLALPVIPELKLTDRGLVDVNLFQHVSPFAGG